MKRSLLLLSLGFLLFAPIAEARPKLTKADARLAAEIEAYDYFNQPAYSDWANDRNIGRCMRKTRYRVRCTGSARGEEFLGTCSDVTYKCNYRHHECFFNAPVHQAGYSAIARITGVSCNRYDYQQ